jgi:hypothetical protein
VGKDVRHSLFASRYSLPFLIAPAIEAIFKIAKNGGKMWSNWKPFPS